MATLRITSLHNSVWKIFGFQHEAAVAERDHFQSEMKTNLGPETASQIQDHADAALGRSQIDVNPALVTRREFYELLALEKTIEEIADQIDANAVFIDTDGLLSTKDILPHLDDHGLMPTENVKQFLEMVRTAEDETEGRRRLVDFLERAIKMGEAVKYEL